MKSKSHGRTEGKASKHSRDDAQMQKFLRDTGSAMRRLELVLGRLQSRRRALESEMSDLQSRWEKSMDAAVNTLLPDLSPRSIAKLTAAVPNFLTRHMREEVDDAHNVTVPFFTWLFGGSKRYREAELRTTRSWLISRLRAHLGTLSKLPETFSVGTSISTDYGKVTTELKEVKEREVKAKLQLEGLRRTLASFQHNPRAVPPQMAEAMEKAAKEKSAAGVSASTTSNSDRDFNYVDDVLIPQIIWDTYFNPRGGSYYDRAPQRSDTFRHSREDDRPAAQREDGNASARMRDAEESPRGDTSVRMSDAAPVRSGNASARMKPVIAEPFAESSEPSVRSERSEGNTSVRMSAPETNSYSDRSESGRGTSY
jgi:hypothetical protein